MKKNTVALMLGIVASLALTTGAEAQTKRKRTSDTAAAADSGSRSSSRGNYGVAGCGLGTYVFKDKSSKVHQVLAATTNGTSGNQTFGISTGTLNCEIDGVVAKRAEQEVFVAANYDSLSREAAAGRGESLEAYADLMGCSKSEEFSRVVRRNHREIFGGASAEEAQRVIENTRNVIERDQSLAASCQVASM